MKNKIIGLLLVLGLLSIYPMWRYFSHANVFARAMLDHASGLGKWSHSSINTSFDGLITIRGVTFSPHQYQQQFNIDSITIKTNPMFLLKNDPIKLGYMLPEILSISVNSAMMSGGNTSEILDNLRKESMWMLMAGFAGSFGCNRESYTSFDEKSWSNILDKDQIYNLDLYYSRQTDKSLDVDLILDAENLFSSTWSSNLKSSYNDDQIIFDELIVEKLYYSYLDNGFNLKRNNACMQNYKSSFAAYRLSSAEHVQKYLRSHFSKELPSVLINWYQRMLAPDVEYNAIITLDDRKYLFDVYQIDQRTLYENAQVEVATNENDYLPVSLTEIDFTNIDSDLLIKENQKRKEREQQRLEEAKRKQSEKNKANIYTTGGKKSRQVPLNRIGELIGKKIRIKTSRGRPIIGRLNSIKDGVVSIDTIYKTGRAQLSVEIKKIASVELMN